MMRQIQSKKIQIPQNSQQLFLAKCFIEQRIGNLVVIRGNPSDGSSVFKIKHTQEIAAVTKNNNLYVFSKPLKDFKGLPLDTKVVSLSKLVKTDGVMRCTKCKSWVKHADVTRCPCGGHFRKKKRFHVLGETTESIDAEYLEIQSALKDIKISAKMNCKPRQKTYVPTGITPPIAGMSSIETNTTPYVGFLTTVAVKSNGKLLEEDEKYSFFKAIGVDVESIQDDETKEYGILDTQRRAKIAVDSWNSIPKDTEEMHIQRRKQSIRKQRLYKNHTRKPTQNKLSFSKKKMMICSRCGEKTPALVESKCTKCFLKVTN